MFQTLLLDQKEVPPQLIDADFPDVDERSQKSGSFKGSKISQPQRHQKDKGGYRKTSKNLDTQTNCCNHPKS